jgi:hypothetical protein
MENLEFFRSNSQDIGLINQYYNEGVFYDSIDLDLTQPSSSSSLSLLAPVFASDVEEFVLQINLEIRSYPDGVLPENLDLYVYGEELDGESAPGLIILERVANNRIEARLGEGYLLDGTNKASFRLNIESEKFFSSRTKFEFTSNTLYSSDLILSIRTDGGGGRLSEEYINYLQGWISDFWSAWDAGTLSSLVPLEPPFPNSFKIFYPFAHSYWKLLSEVGSQNQGSVSALNISFVPGNTSIVRGQNVLGVSSGVFDCMTTPPNRLYNFAGYGTPSSNVNPFGPPRTYKEPDTSFDCRSFAVIGREIIENQLKATCPKATAKVIGICTHYMVYVDLGGDPDPCCVGSFIWEPQSGEVYENAQEWLDLPDNAGCLNQFNKPPTIYEPGKENSDGDFGCPNWDDDPVAVTLLSYGICECLKTGRSSQTDDQMKQICDSNGMEQWVKDNMGFGCGKSPSITPFENLECKLCVEEWTSTYNCELQDWENSSFPTQSCVSQKDLPKSQGEWIEKPFFNCERTFTIVTDSTCSKSYECATTPGPKSKPSGTPSNCCGSWCELDSSGKRTGKCFDGSIDSYNTQTNVGSFRPDEKCSSGSCPNSDRFCVHDWLIEYDCAKREWKKIGDESYRFCEFEDEINKMTLDQWVQDPDSCDSSYYRIKGDPCSVDGDCTKILFSDGPIAVSGFNTKTHPAPNDCCGSWCTGEFGCDGKFYINGCDSGTLEKWTIGDTANKVQSFQNGKICDEITCTIETLPKCGAWCTGEFGCDGKFYVDDCDSGTFDYWLLGDGAKKVQNFQEGKSCGEITCAVETPPDCIYKCDESSGCVLYTPSPEELEIINQPGYKLPNGFYYDISVCESDCIQRFECRNDPSPPNFWTTSTGCSLLGYGSPSKWTYTHPSFKVVDTCDECDIVGYYCNPSSIPKTVPLFGTEPCRPVFGEPGVDAAQYSTANECKEGCQPRYNCYSDGGCGWNGSYEEGYTQEECKMYCVNYAWKCDEGAGCTPIYGMPGTPLNPGEYETEQDCKESCGLKNTGCMQDGCIQSYNQDYPYDGECDPNCTENWQCNNCSCEWSGWSINGSSYNDCQASCSHKSWECEAGIGYRICYGLCDNTGQYATEEECQAGDPSECPSL